MPTLLRPPAAAASVARPAGSLLAERAPSPALSIPPVCSNSPLIGRSVRELQFRDRFNAAVVAVARSGERIRAKPGDIVLQRGDILLLDTGAAFAQQNKVISCA